MTKRGKTALLLLGAALILGSGCGKKPAAPQTSPPAVAGTIRPIRGTVVVRGSDVKVLNPLSRKSGSDFNVLKYYINPFLLTEEPDTFALVPWLAASLPRVSTDGLTVDWTIRDEAMWQDGVPVSGEDAAFTWRLLASGEAGFKNVHGALGDIASVTATGSKTFRVVYKTLYYRAVASLGLEFGLVPKHATPADPAAAAALRQTTYCGPYRIVDWADGQLKLDRVDPWWGDGLPAFRSKWRIRRFVVKSIDDPVQVVEQLRAGLLDLTSFDNFADFVTKTKDADFTANFGKLHYHLVNWMQIAWNCADPLFTDARVRRAMSHAIRRDEISQVDFDGLARSVTGPFPRDSELSDQTIAPHPYSLPKARDLLKEAGWSDTDKDGVLDKDGLAFRFSLLRPSKSLAWLNTPIAFLREDLRSLGIVMEVVKDEELFKHGGEHLFQALIIQWSFDAVDPDPWSLLHSQETAGGFNWANYKSAQMDALLELYRKERDLKNTRILAHRIHRVLHDDQPISFILNPPIGLAWSKRLQGVQAHKLGFRQWDFWVDDDR